MQDRTEWPPKYRWLHEYALTKPEAVPEFKETWDAMLYRLHDKIFALLLRSAAHGTLVNLKCDPYLSLAYRERHGAVIPGWHMNKLHWVSLVLRDNPPEDICRELVDLSYDLVKAKLPGKRGKTHRPFEPEW